MPAVDTADIGPLALLPLPNVRGLSRLQTEGAVCVWCGAGLITYTARDLGARPGPDGVTIFPRGCGRCVRGKAAEVHTLHVSKCGECLRNQPCVDRTDLQRLASQGAP
jgi:hypothetical protein